MPSRSRRGSVLSAVFHWPCAVCGATVSRRRTIPGPKPVYCSHRCRQKAEYGTNPKRFLEAGKRWRIKIRSEVLKAYGQTCACCGEHTAEFLSMDHMSGGGRQHRKQLPGGDIYLWLKRQGFPKDQFRLLCHNCNFSRGVYGYCPHDDALALLWNRRS